MLLSLISRDILMKIISLSGNLFLTITKVSELLFFFNNYRLTQQSYYRKVEIWQVGNFHIIR